MIITLVITLLIAALLITITALVRAHRIIRQVYQDPAYGILTRQGGEMWWRQERRNLDVVFFDLDEMHRLNAEHGYAEVDRRIATAFCVRQTDHQLFRWYSGDEIVATVPAGDGLGAAQRLLDALKAEDLSATMGLVPNVRADRTHLTEIVARASALVQAAKAANERGVIRIAE